MIDPYAWVSKMTTEDRSLFKREEEEHTMVSLLKYDNLHRSLLRELEHYKKVPNVNAVTIGEHIYYRRIGNPADSMTLYRYPTDHDSFVQFLPG
jgi:hypothetical protein